MGYVFAILSSICGAAKGYAGKKSSYALENFPAMLFFSMLRTLVCALLGLAIWVIIGDFSLPSPKALAICILSGISMSGFLLSWISAVKGGAYVRLDVCCQMGMIIPCIFAAPLLGESVNFFQYTALAFLIVAVILLDNSKKADTKIKIKDIAILFAVWLFSGTNSLCVKLYAFAGGTDSVFYNLTTFASSAAVLAISYVLQSKRGTKIALPKSIYTVYLPIMATCLFINIFLTTLSAQMLPAILLFPLQTALGLILSCIMAVFLFKEKLPAKNIIGIAIAIISLFIINFM
ncbi:MAG: hypothetical protein E7598_06690 [Ruminococcaceae bacterium]|nr:hypothetical protein [Oscillospiraceae bacterium]